MTDRTLRLMAAAFRTTETGPDGYAMIFKFPTLEALHAADDEWRAILDAHTAAQPAPDAVAEARDIADFPEDGTWAVLYPGYYGPFTACWADGAWRLCEEADLRQATCWTPLDIAALTKEPRP